MTVAKGARQANEGEGPVGIRVLPAADETYLLSWSVSFSRMCAHGNAKDWGHDWSGESILRVSFKAYPPLPWVA